MIQDLFILRLLTIMSAAYVEITDSLDDKSDEIPTSLLRYLDTPHIGTLLPYPQYLDKARKILQEKKSSVIPSQQMTLFHDYLISLRDVSTDPNMTECLVQISDLVERLISDLRSRENFTNQKFFPPRDVLNASQVSPVYL